MVHDFKRSQSLPSLWKMANGDGIHSEKYRPEKVGDYVQIDVEFFCPFTKYPSNDCSTGPLFSKNVGHFLSTSSHDSFQ